MQFEPIIGLEVHVQLATQSKLFCRCSTTFGAEPNTQVCPVCLGLPGSLPVMNGTAYRLALRAALALDCEIPALTKWDRKQYFYPDLPKGYQISQYDIPMSHCGHLEIDDPKGTGQVRRIGIIRAHLEEDAGKSLHDEADGIGDTRIDLNRTGTPLLEIVSAPDMQSAAEAKAYLTELKLLLTYLQISDCNMQEGSLRVDANVNLRVVDSGEESFTPIVEVKNMNSFRAVERALLHECTRQAEEWKLHRRKKGDFPKQTRGWDDTKEQTYALRSKEESSDYRYFPDPDLVPVTTSAVEIARVRSELGELPAHLRRTLQSDFGLSAYDADVLVNQGYDVIQYFREAVQVGKDAKQVSNWLQRDVLRRMNEQGITIREFPLSAAGLGSIIQAIKDGKLDGSRSSEVFQRMCEHSEDLPTAMRSLGIRAVSEDELRELCRELLRENPQVVEDLRQGKDKALGALIGQAKKRNPNANPSQVRGIVMALVNET
jgi:aspartyl-tRNA(Asn)/glutamyl-tRNA(Gln) amidotransferase subunit B